MFSPNMGVNWQLAVPGPAKSRFGMLENGSVDHLALELEHSRARRCCRFQELGGLGYDFGSGRVSLTDYCYLVRMDAGLRAETTGNGVARLSNRPSRSGMFTYTESTASLPAALAASSTADRECRATAR